ncbi:TPR end-of-group domain-containing protein [Ruminiclostridium josui]|uniref:TPR end-of-group domain-containing protein n=1 Tax=Ruminiclostridium josui TaxID=1499 RepID=UPI000A8B3E8B
MYYNRACFYVHTGELNLALTDLITATDLSSELEEFMKTDNEIDPLREMELYKKRFAYV